MKTRDRERKRAHSRNGDSPISHNGKSGKHLHYNRIAVLRRRSRLTQKELAKLLDRDVSTISRHENGTRMLDEHDILEYARVFKCHSYELFMKPPKGQESKFTDDAEG